MQAVTPPKLVTPAAAGALLALFLGGCATTYEVKVDAISQSTDRAAQVQSFEIKSANPSVDEDSLRYKEVAGYIKTALSGKGLYEAPEGQKADVVVSVDYGMDAPRVKYETVSTPVMARVGGGVTYQRVPILDQKGQIIGYRTVAIYEPPRMEVIGYEESVRPVIVYEKYLKVSARENAPVTEGRPAAEVWSVNVSAEDESKDLRKYLPILASATADYVGTNTQEEKPVKIKEGDESVAFVKKGL